MRIYLTLLLLLLASFTCIAQEHWEEGELYHQKGGDMSYCDSVSVELIRIKECNCEREQNFNSSDPFAPIKPVIEHTCVEKRFTKHCKKAVWVSESGKKDVLIWNGKHWVKVRFEGTYWYFRWEKFTKTL